MFPSATFHVTLLQISTMKYAFWHYQHYCPPVIKNNIVLALHKFPLRIFICEQILKRLIPVH